MHIEVNTIDIKNYNISILKGQSSYKSMWLTMFFAIFIIPKEICNRDILLHVCIIFLIGRNCLLEAKLGEYEVHIIDNPPKK